MSEDYATRSWARAVEMSNEIDASVLTLSSSILTLSVGFYDTIGTASTWLVVAGWWLLAAAIAATFVARGMAVRSNIDASRIWRAEANDESAAEALQRWEGSTGARLKAGIVRATTCQMVAFLGGIVSTVLFASLNV